MTVRDEVRLHKVGIGLVTVAIRGITPLLQNKPLERVLEHLDRRNKGGAKRGREPIAEDDWMGHIHYTENGGYGHPAAAFKSAMARAAKHLKGIAMVDIDAGLVVYGDSDGLVKLDCSEPIERRDFGPIGGRQGADIFYRPMYKQWGATLTIGFDAQFLSAEQVVNMLAKAGAFVGVGAYRIINRGPFGQFEVVHE